ncbi:MAG: NAD(P)H-hydrate dehydratase [Planctomycetota bacterium]
MLDLTDTPLPTLPPRDPRSPKGDFGRAMLIGGSRGMSGAIAMAGLACLRSGAGLVSLGVPRCVQPEVAAFSPAYTTRGLTDDDPGVLYWANCFDLERNEDDFDVWAVGPGLGEPSSTGDLVGRMHRSFTSPMVIDADGLNGLAIFLARYGERPDELLAPRVLTPHPGEFARLAGDDTLAARARGGEQERVEAAATLADRHGAGRTVVVLKGAGTVVTDGERFAVNANGNPGMATGGSGDVLTGVITALVAQGLEAFDAARLGVHVHGLAGDLAAASVGQVSLVATDLIDHLPAAFQSLGRPVAVPSQDLP